MDVLRYFQLNEQPFRIGPDPRFLYLSDQVKESIAKCEYMARERIGPIYIYGPIGAGKTSVRLLRQAGALVTELATQGAQLSQRGLYHSRLIAAHDSQDMAAYRIALNGYVAAAREAFRKAKRKNR